jgi:hypothetical protein
MRFTMIRHPLLGLTAALAALSLCVTPAFAGEDDDDATLHASQGCVHSTHARVAVSGGDIASVTFYLDGRRLRTLTEPNADGRYAISMACSRLSVGAHRGRVVVAFGENADTPGKTLRFQITRPRRASARFTG